MLKDILGFVGGILWLFLRVIVIIGLTGAGIYCFGTMFMFRLVWDGLIRLGIAVACGLAVFGILRLSRDRDDGPVTEDDFRP